MELKFTSFKIFFLREGGGGGGASSGHQRSERTQVGSC